MAKREREHVDPVAALWIADGWEPNCQDDYEWATETGQYARPRNEAVHPTAMVRQLRRRIYDENQQIESMRADWTRIYERSDGEDLSLDARYEDICAAEDRVKRLRWQLRMVEKLVSADVPTPAA